MPNIVQVGLGIPNMWTVKHSGLVFGSPYRRLKSILRLYDVC